MTKSYIVFILVILSLAVIAFVRYRLPRILIKRKLDKINKRKL